MFWAGLIIELVFIAGAVIAAFYGYRRGLIGQVVWMFSTFIGFLVASRFADDLVDVTGVQVHSRGVTIALSFVLIILVVMTLVRYAGIWITKLFKDSVAGTVNSALGAAFNLVTYLVLALAIVVVARIVSPEADEAIDNTFVIKRIMTPVQTFMDEKIFHRDQP